MLGVSYQISVISQSIWVSLGQGLGLQRDLLTAFNALFIYFHGSWDGLRLGGSQKKVQWGVCIKVAMNGEQHSAVEE